MGSMHGGFVALLNWAGFSASGLELSPWVAQFARETFHIPTLVGPVEEQSFGPGTLDVIAMMDVLEHFPDPIRTLKHCLALVKKNGILLIQTPQFPETKSYESMVAHGDRFLEHLKDDEHLYLFSQRSIREFFHRLGADHLIFETPVFSHYDMFFVASQAPISKIPADQIEERLRASPQGKMVQALIDLRNELEKFKGHLEECEADRAARLVAIQELTRLLHEPLYAKLVRKFRALGK